MNANNDELILADSLVIPNKADPNYGTIVKSLFSRVLQHFEASSFIAPHGFFSFLTANPHWQTIVGSEAIRNRYFHVERGFKSKSERFQTPDDDFFDVDYTEGFESNNKVVFILHGLEGNMNGPLVTKMAKSFIGYGFDCCMVSFRGCSNEDNNSPGAYHVGFTTDVHQLVREIHRRYPTKRLYVSGFSLGGNVSLKFLSELGETAKDLNVCGCVAACVPFTLKESQKKLDQGFSRFAYSEVFFFLKFYSIHCVLIGSLLIDVSTDA